MNTSLAHLAELFSSWLIDYYFAATLVLLTAFLAWRWMRQPAHRITVAWAALVQLVMLAVVCALPWWPKLSLVAARSPEPAVESSSDFARKTMFQPPIRKKPIPIEKSAAAHIEETPDDSKASVFAGMDWNPRTLFSAGYLACAAIVGVWLVGGAVAAVRVCGRASEASKSLKEQLSKIVRDRGRLPRLLVSTRVGSAVALGVLRPTIILPADLADGGTETIRAVLAHEWAHLRNRDLWLLAFGRCLLPLLFAHPLMWWLRRAIRVDQELLADALAAGDDRHFYAETLLALVRDSLKPSRMSVTAAVGIWEGPSQLSRRITMLLDDTFRIHPSGSRRWKLQAFGFMLILGAACSLLTLTPAQSAEKKKDAKAEKIESRMGTLVPAKRTEATDKANIKKTNKIRLGSYLVEPPDILSIEMPQLKPLPSYHIGTYDVLQIRASTTIPGQPIDNYYLVEAEGDVNLGSTYGSVRVIDMAIEDARQAIRRKLDDVLSDPDISVQLARTAAAQPVTGQYLVGPDGNINMRTYGVVKVAGMNAKEIKNALQKHLAQFFDSPEVSVDIVGYNSKVYFVITGETDKGDNVRKMPVTGTEMVLDALATVGEPSRLSGKKVWVARPTSSESGEQILPVDFAAITHGGSAATNYQIMPGDRVFIAEEVKAEQTPDAESDAKANNNIGMEMWSIADPSAASAENANFPVLPGVEALSRPEIVAELKLTDNQNKSLEALRKKWSDFEKKTQEEMSKYGKDNPPPKEVTREVEKKYEEIIETIRNDAQALLTPEQRKIIKEARLSENACWLLAEPSQLKKNGLTDLTDDQKNRISDLHKHMIAKIEEAQKETKLKITHRFNEEQRAKLRDVLLQPEMSDSSRIEMYPLEKEGENLLIPTLRPFPDFSLPETQKALNLTESQMKLVKEILDGSKTLSEKFAREMRKLPPNQQKRIDNAGMGTLTLSAFSTYAFSGDVSSAEEETTREEVKRRKEAWEDWRKEPINKLSVELQNKFEASLTPEQLEKYKEMAFDSLHLYQIDDIAALHLAGASKEQKDAIRQTIIQSGKSDRESSVATGKKMLEVLTPQQRKKLGDALDAASNRIQSLPFAEGDSGATIEESGK